REGGVDGGLVEVVAKLGGDAEAPLGVDRVLVAPPEHARRPPPRLVAARSRPGRNGPPWRSPTSPSHFIPLCGAHATKLGKAVSRGKMPFEKEKNGAWQENNRWWGPGALSTSDGVGGGWPPKEAWAAPAGPEPGKGSRRGQRRPRTRGLGVPDVEGPEEAPEAGGALGQLGQLWADGRAAEEREHLPVVVLQDPLAVERAREDARAPRHHVRGTGR